MVRIVAKPHVLNSVRNQTMPWWKALAEFIDNSLDANAFRIVIDVTNRKLTITDDGNGAADILALFTLGEHKKSISTKLGCYGIGAKDAWLSCADEMSVETVHGGIQTNMTVNYNDLIANDWNTADPESKKTTKASGTKIVLPLRNGKNRPSTEAFDELAFAFTPALDSGRQIFSSSGGRRKLLLPKRMPARQDVIACDFSIDGKEVSIDIGIMDGVDDSFRGPLWLIYQHRIIERTSLGIGQYSSRRIAGTIKLGKGWKLRKHKDSIAEEDEERLADEIFSRIESILQKAESMAESVESLKFLNELEDKLNSWIKGSNRREKRKRKPSSKPKPGVKPSGTGRKRKKAHECDDDESGSVDCTGHGTGRKRGFIVDYCDEPASLIGKFERRGCRVYLNNSHPFIAVHKNKNLFALLTVAASLIADHECRYDSSGNSLLKFNFDDFATALGGIMADFKKSEVGSE